MRARGAVLGSLVASTAVLLLVFTLLAVIFQHRALADVQSNGKIARDHAESVVQLALEKIVADLDYGKTPTFERIHWQAEGVPGEGFLTFDADIALQNGIPRSYNNHAQTAPADNAGRSVPAECIQLLGVGRCQGETRTIEVLIHAPTFPFVVASSGPFITEGRSLVARVPAGTLPGAALDIDDMLPGDIASNSADPEAIVLSALTIVKGDVQAPGGIRLEPGAVVEGATRTESETTKLPSILLEDFDPRVQQQPGLQTLTPGIFRGTISGPAVVEGDMHAPNGLTLDGGWLFVNGNLKVNGGISGKGAMIVTGETDIQGQVSLEADNAVALLSRGDVKIHGTGQSSSFRGQVYTEGDFFAHNVSVMGSLVANSPDPARGTIRLKDAISVQDPAPLEVEVTTAPQPRVILAGEFDAPNPMGWEEFHSNGIIYCQDDDDVPEGVYEPNGSNWDVWLYDGAAQDRKGSFLGQIIFRRVPEDPGDDDMIWVAEPTWMPGVQVELDDIDRIRRPRPGRVQNPAPGPAPAEQSFDFSEFLAPEEKLRVLIWREI